MGEEEKRDTLAEYVLQSSLQHGNILPVHHSLPSSDGVFHAIFMPVMKKNLLDFLTDSEDLLSMEVVQSMANQLFSGLAYLHDEKKIIHRDIKPENVCFYL
jgi:serine/threonine protein kinase